MSGFPNLGSKNAPQDVVCHGAVEVAGLWRIFNLFCFWGWQPLDAHCRLFFPFPQQSFLEGVVSPESTSQFGGYRTFPSLFFSACLGSMFMCKRCFPSVRQPVTPGPPRNTARAIQVKRKVDGLGIAQSEGLLGLPIKLGGSSLLEGTSQFGFRKPTKNTTRIWRVYFRHTQINRIIDPGLRSRSVHVSAA